MATETPAKEHSWMRGRIIKESVDDLDDGQTDQKLFLVELVATSRLRVTISNEKRFCIKT